MAAVSPSRSASEARRSRPAAAGALPPTKATPEQKLVEAVIELMEAGTTPWRRPWDGRSGGHHLNLLSGRRYRGANPVLLTFGMHRRGSALPYWCGFAEARARGLVPRKGSKAVAIVRPQVQGRSRPTESSPIAHHQPSPGTGEPAGAPEVGNQEAGAQERTWIRYKPLPLFNAADLVGPGLEELIERRRFSEGLERRSEPERLAAAEAVLGAWPVPVSHGGDRACYWPEPDRIQLPDRCAFASPAAFYATWAHEGIHSTGHPSRLARDLGGGCGSESYAREELVAELGAVLLGDRLEIGSDSANHAAYLAHWVQLLHQSPRLLFQVLSEARRAADLICPEAVEPDPETL
ncbi:MAG: zincin-like metallopeptidase domain-containing protein [Cyanobacteria bacterium]|nr:zincin-like metallopeptidase domain-containing protein [Cyanobacteriota bacterium]